MKLRYYFPRIVGFTLAAMIICIMLFSPRTPSTVEAQSFAPFAVTVTFPASGSEQTLPACTTGGTNCIPNYKQIGHSVGVTYASTPAATCNSILEASYDNIHFLSLATVTSTYAVGSTLIQGAQANGYYGYMRVEVQPCNKAQTVTYVGYASPLPLPNLSMNITQQVSTLATVYSFNQPFILTGFECTNASSSPAYLQLFFTAGNTLGTAWVFEAQVGQDAPFVYSGPPISSFGSLTLGTANTLQAGAATGQGGSTAVSTALDCNFQVNQFGPYAPFNPTGPGF